MFDECINLVPLMYNLYQIHFCMVLGVIEEAIWFDLLLHHVWALYVRSDTALCTCFQCFS